MPLLPKRTALFGLGTAFVLTALAGCGDKNAEPTPRPRAMSAEDEALFAGTLGGVASVTNGEPQLLRGFGLVIGLKGKGSTDCPTTIRDYLIDSLGKQFGLVGASRRKNLPTPAELIDSPDSAVVEVRGMVPPGARKGARFDVQVRALAGTSTQSLEGGMLLPTELRIFAPNASGQGLVTGEVLADAAGPVFINPFAGSTAGPSDINPRDGATLGGGRTLEERKTRLMLSRPNYTLARAIESRVNERFRPDPNIASAESAAIIVVTTPPRYENDAQRFRDVLAHLYIDGRTIVAEPKLQELTARAMAPDAPLERISATWEGIGPSALPSIQPLYAHQDSDVRFYAARTGLRLGDRAALAVLDTFATGGEHDRRLLAIREIGNCSAPSAAQVLVPLLNERDQEVRIAAYEALVARKHQAVQSVTFPHVLDRKHINLTLDAVESTGPPLIYVRRTRSPRIAVFGSRMPMNSPLFYSEPDDSVIIHTVDGSTDVQLFAKSARKMSEEIVLPARVMELVCSLADLPEKDKAGRLRGIALPYSRVVKILFALSRDDTVPAHVALEQTSLTDLLGPESTQRPEADEASPQEQPPAEPTPKPVQPAGEESDAMLARKVDESLSADPVRTEGLDEKPAGRRETD
jgi:hypothetical protein